MRKYLLAIVACFSFLMMITPVQAATIPVSTPAEKIVPMEVLYQRIATMKIKDLQKKLGRKLSFKEKISFLLLKHKAKHYKSDASSPGQTALVFGIAGVVLFIVGLFVPYVLIGSLITGILAIVTGSIARKKDPEDTKGHIGKLLGWITIGLIALLFILAAIIIASWASWI